MSPSTPSLSLWRSVEVALARLGREETVRGASSVSGGCINNGARLTMSGGTEYFLKWNASAPPGMFEAEATGLRALAAVGPLRVPRAIVSGGGSSAPAWLLLEYIAPGRSVAGSHAALGRGLAALHSAPAPDGFGWPQHNWLGSLPQENTESDSWSGFWRDRRLLPQLEMARRAGHLEGPEGRICDRVIDLLPTALADVENSPPSLLHGDLWSGNVLFDESGAPVLIDPAVYRGHSEVDLAMTALFGGFSESFYAGYDEARRISPEFEAYRRDLYQMYYLLAHVNLFGSSYVPGVTRAAERVVSAFA